MYCSSSTFIYSWQPTCQSNFSTGGTHPWRSDMPMPSPTKYLECHTPQPAFPKLITNLHAMAIYIPLAPSCFLWLWAADGFLLE